MTFPGWCPGKFLEEGISQDISNPDGGVLWCWCCSPPGTGTVDWYWELGSRVVGCSSLSFRLDGVVGEF